MAFLLHNILSKDSVLSPVLCYSKKRAFEEIAKKASIKTSLSVKELLEGLLERENIGSTYVANGFAVPHAIIPDNIKECAVMIILAKPVHYNIIENSHADFIFALFLHQDTIDKYDEDIQELASLLSQSSYTKHLRYISNIATQVYSALISYADKDEEPSKVIDE